MKFHSSINDFFIQWQNNEQIRQLISNYKVLWCWFLFEYCKENTFSEKAFQIIELKEVSIDCLYPQGRFTVCYYLNVVVLNQICKTYAKQNAFFLHYWTILGWLFVSLSVFLSLSTESTHNGNNNNCQNNKKKCL